MMQLPASKRRITDRKGRSVMKKFNYTIQGKAGIHARPAGVLVKKQVLLQVPLPWKKTELLSI